MQTRFNRHWSYVLIVLFLAVLFSNTITNTALALPTSGNCDAGVQRCYMGYANPLRNTGMEAQVLTPKVINYGSQSGVFSAILVNTQGSYNSGDVYGFIQMGIVWAQGGIGNYCGHDLGVLSEYGVSPDNLHPVTRCDTPLALNTQYSLAVQYDANNSRWLYSVNGFGAGNKFFRQESLSDVGFVGGASYSVYGETNSPTIQMGGADALPGDAVVWSHIGYQAGYNTGFQYPAVTAPNQYNSGDCGFSPCPYSKTFGNFADGWATYVWTN